MKSKYQKTIKALLHVLEKIHMVCIFRITYGTQMLPRQIYVMVEK